LIAALEHRSDVELRLSCGKSIRAHSLKLSLASSVLGDLIDSIMDEQITAMRAAKKKRDYRYEGISDAPLTMPHITVHTVIIVVSLETRRVVSCLLMCHGSFASMQRDGKYEDWMEVLRLIYHSGEMLYLEMSRINTISPTCTPSRFQMCFSARAQVR
jgi:hypothetical protein